MQNSSLPYSNILLLSELYILHCGNTLVMGFCASLPHSLGKLKISDYGSTYTMESGEEPSRKPLPAYSRRGGGCFEEMRMRSSYMEAGVGIASCRPVCYCIHLCVP